MMLTLAMSIMEARGLRGTWKYKRQMFFFFRGMLVMACDDHLLLLGMVFDVFLFLMFVERTFVHPKRVFSFRQKTAAKRGHQTLA